MVTLKNGAYAMVYSTRRCEKVVFLKKKNKDEGPSQQVQNLKNSKHYSACPLLAQVSLVCILFITTTREFVHDKRMYIALWMHAGRLGNSDLEKRES